MSKNTEETFHKQQSFSKIINVQKKIHNDNNKSPPPSAFIQMKKSFREKKNFQRIITSETFSLSNLSDRFTFANAVL